MEASRRAFLKATTATAAAGFFAPRVLGMAPKHGLGNPVVGEGEHTYECIHDWAQVPSDIAFGNTHGVAQDSQGLVHIKHTVHATSSKADAICVFDPDGKFIRSWGAEYKGGAHGLHLSKESGGEFLYLCDQARGIVDKTTLTGEKVWSKSAPLESGVYNSQGEYHATNVAVVPMGFPRAGEFFVGDGYGKSWIHRYSAKGEYLGTFGGPGKERGQLSCPHGLMIDTRGADAKTPPRLVVADRSNRRLQYFDLDGRSQGFVTDELRSPCHFHERNGVLLIPDLEARVTLFDKSNKLLAHLGDGTNFGLRDKPREQFIAGKFIAPHSAIFDRDGNIFVVEWVEVGRVTKLRKV
jgi:hypothetical protein